MGRKEESVQDAPCLITLAMSHVVDLGSADHDQMYIQAAIRFECGVMIHILGHFMDPNRFRHHRLKESQGLDSSGAASGSVSGAASGAVSGASSGAVSGAVSGDVDVSGAASGSGCLPITNGPICSWSHSILRWSSNSISRLNAVFSPP